MHVHSHSLSNITLYLDHSSTHYLEYKILVFLNISQVNIRAYDSLGLAVGYARVTPTTIQQAWGSARAAFTILGDVQVDYESVLTGFSGYEQAMIKDTDWVIMIARTVVTFDHIEFSREEGDYDHFGNFIFTVNLQDKSLYFSKWF